MQRDAVTVERSTRHASLELNWSPAPAGSSAIIREPTVNRPGLVLSGFTRYFANKRVQVIGNAEAYLPEIAVRRGAGQALRDLLLLQGPVRRVLAATCTRTSCF